MIHDYSLVGYLLCPIAVVQSHCRENGVTAEMNEVSNLIFLHHWYNPILTWFVSSSSCYAGGR